MTLLFKTTVLTVILGLIGTHLSGQTNFEGGIYVDTKWTKAASPYIITGDIVVFPSRTLTLEPGTEVRFEGNYKLEIRGQLISIGTKDDTIFYTSNKQTPQKWDWQGVMLKCSQGASAMFEYSSFSYAKCVNEVEFDDNYISPVYFSNCRFDNNIVVFSGYCVAFVSISTSTFTNNDICIDAGNMNVKECVFEDNGYVLYETSEVHLDRCTIRRNNIALYGCYATIKECHISENQIAIKWWYGGFQLLSNTIINNEVGIELKQWGDHPIIIKGNKICNNTINVLTKSDKSIDLTRNCWCTSDSAEIETRLIDGYDNIDLGLFNYDIYDDDCSSVIRSVIKDPGIEVQEPYYPEGINDHHLSPLKVYPNPVNSYLTFEFVGSISSGYRISIYDNLGRAVQSMREESSYKFTMNVSQYKPGIYFYHVIIDSGVGYWGRFIVE